MKRTEDLVTNQKYNKLTVLCKIEKSTYLFLCDCGKKKNLQKYDVVSGRVKSCGCWNKELREDNYSGVAGATKCGKIWVANLRFKGKSNYLGRLVNFLDAVEARILAELEFYGKSKVKLKRY